MEQRPPSRRGGANQSRSIRAWISRAGIRPRGFHLSVAGIGMMPFTGTFVFLAIRFHMFLSLIVMASVLTLANIALFVRWRDRKRGKPSFFGRLGRSNRLFPRKLSLSNEGKILLMITFGMGFAAVNTGNNLFYLIVGLLLALVVFSGILSEFSLRKIAWQRAYPEQVYANQVSSGAVTVTNSKRRLASNSLLVSELFDAAEVTVADGRLLSLEPGSSAQAFPLFTFTKRGEYTSAGLLIATSYPFSFFRKSRFYPQGARFLVFPDASLRIPEIERFIAGGDQQEGAGRGRGTEFYSARNFQPGDDPRDIHWKRSATSGDLVMKEYQALTSRRVVLVLGPCLSPETRDEQDGELAISMAASIAARLDEAGWGVGLSLPGTFIPARDGGGNLRNILEQLALVPLDEDPYPDLGPLVAAAEGLDTILLLQTHQSWEGGVEAGFTISTGGDA